VLIKAKVAIDKANDNGTTPLYMASQFGHLGIVKALIKAEATVDKAMDNGESPLIIAADRGHAAIVAALIEVNADIDQAKNNGNTPIYAACQKGHAPIVRLLLEAGARSTGLVHKDSWSPLHTAAAAGHLECVKLLTGFRPGTPAWITFLAGSGSPAELAAYLAPPANRPPTFLPKIFDRMYLEPIWKFTRERFSDLHLKDGKGYTALGAAEACNQKKTAKLLRSMMVM
jgi:ankyrin repeat protein